MVEDALVGARVQLFLGIDESAHPHSASTGLLATLFQREIRNYLRKFVFVRIVLAVARLYPEVSLWLPLTALFSWVAAQVLRRKSLSLVFPGRAASNCLH